jgi:hypothetical protein
MIEAMMKSRFSKTGAAFFLVSLGAACSSSVGTNPTGDGGKPMDGSIGDGATGDGGNNNDGGGTNPDAGKDAASNGSPASVNLGTAGTYVILAKSGISTVPTSAVTGALGLSPAAASYITGFSLTADSTNVFSTSPQVTGHIYASDYTAPTPSNLTTAVSDMQTAFTDAAGRAPDVTELGAGDVGGMTITRGVYKWGTGLLIPTNVTLSGSATDVFIFQIAQDLTMASATHVLLIGGVVPKNIFWQVSGMVDLGTTAHFEGVILSQTAITLETGATINGRLLAQTMVSIDGSAVVQP